MLQKYGRHGNPKYHYFRLGAEDTQLQWESKNVSACGTQSTCVCQRTNQAMLIHPRPASRRTSNTSTPQWWDVLSVSALTPGLFLMHPGNPPAQNRLLSHR
eukprot:1161819-Pelagomonas_calceolata.AAC.8